MEPRRQLSNYICDACCRRLARNAHGSYARVLRRPFFTFQRRMRSPTGNIAKEGEQAIPLTGYYAGNYLHT